MQRTVAVLKARLNALTADVDTNTLLIERMHEEREQFARRMSEVERAKRRIDVDESEKQTRLLRQQVAFRAALNQIVMRSDDLSLGMMRFQGERATLGACVAGAFAVVCCAVAEAEEAPIAERLENARRMIAESVFL
jgi:phage-related tail protein